MPGFSRAHFCLEAPPWRDVQAATLPVFLAPSRMRWAWRRLAARVALSPGRLYELHRAGPGLRGALSFLLWLDTAACFGVEAVEAVEAQPSLAALMNHCLPEVQPPGRHTGTVTAVVIAKDEETNLPGALESAIGLADDLIVVVDDSSRDATAEVAQQLGARVLRRPLSGNFASQRNHGIAAARTDWVICIDADERLEPDLLPLLRRAMAWPRADAVFLPVLNLITERGDTPVHWPDVQARLFRLTPALPRSRPRAGRRLAPSDLSPPLRSVRAPREEPACAAPLDAALRRSRSARPTAGR